jgi:hypothetical protein
MALTDLDRKLNPSASTIAGALSPPVMAARRTCDKAIAAIDRISGLTDVAHLF